MQIGARVHTRTQYKSFPPQTEGILVEILGRGSTMIEPERTHVVALDPPIYGIRVLPFAAQQLQEADGAT